MTDYKLAPKSVVDELAQFIRHVNGDNKMGAGFLADMICERFHVSAPVVQGEPVAYLRKDQLTHVKRMGPMLGEIADNPRADRVPVYVALQPATALAQEQGGSDAE